MSDIPDEQILAFFAAADTGDLKTLAAIIEQHPGAVKWTRPVAAGSMPFSLQETALLAATAEGQVGAMRLLLDRGADVNAKNGRGWTALHFAAWRGNHDASTLLLSRNANTDVKNEVDYSAAATADLAGHGEIARDIRAAFNTYAMKFMRDGLPATVAAPPAADWKKRVKPGA